jgi:hypothetical protein
VNLNLLRLVLLGPGNLDGEQAVLKFRLDLFRVTIGRKGEGAYELAIRNLTAVEVLLPDLLFMFANTAERQNAVFEIIESGPSFLVPPSFFCCFLSGLYYY